MKFFSRFARWSVLTSLILWAVGWFIVLDPNVLNWNAFGRFFLVLISVAVGVVVASILEVNDEEYEDEL